LNIIISVRCRLFALLFCASMDIDHNYLRFFGLIFLCGFGLSLIVLVIVYFWDICLLDIALFAFYIGHFYVILWIVLSDVPSLILVIVMLIWVKNLEIAILLICGKTAFLIIWDFHFFSLLFGLLFIALFLILSLVRMVCWNIRCSGSIAWHHHNSLIFYWFLGRRDVARLSATATTFDILTHLLKTKYLFKNF